MDIVNSGTWHFFLESYWYQHPINSFWIGLKFFPVSSTWKTRSRYLFSDLIVRSWIYTAQPYYTSSVSPMSIHGECTIHNVNFADAWLVKDFCGARWSLICNVGQLSVARSSLPFSLPRTHRSMALEKTSNQSRKYWLGADIDNFSAKSAMYHYLLYVVI